MITKMNKPRRKDILHEMSPVTPDSSRVDMTVVTKKRSTSDTRPPGGNPINVRCIDMLISMALKARKTRWKASLVVSG